MIKLPNYDEAKERTAKIVKLEAEITSLRVVIKEAISNLMLDPTKRTCYNVAHDLEQVITEAKGLKL